MAWQPVGHHGRVSFFSVRKVGEVMLVPHHDKLWAGSDVGGPSERLLNAEVGRPPDSACNPYQPPAVDLQTHESPDEDEVTEIPPGEYRIRRKLLLLTGDVELPRVCIRTGETSDLIPRTLKVQLRSLLAEFIFGCVLAIATASCGGVVMSILMSVKQPESIAQCLGSGLVVLWCVAAFCLVPYGILRLFSAPATITYFEERGWRKRMFRNLCRLSGAVILGAEVLAFWYGDVRILMVIVPLVGLPVIHLIVVFNTTVVRKRHGIFAIQGLPTQFLPRQTPQWESMTATAS